MGQYYYVANLDKKQFLHPHKFGQGLKLMEFGCSGSGVMTALAVLLADGNGRGGGDLQGEHELIGSWAGDRIVVAGDYADSDSYGIAGTVYSQCGRSEPDEETGERSDWVDISDQIILVLAQDRYLEQDLAENVRDGWPGAKTAPALYAVRDAYRVKQAQRALGVAPVAVR